MRECHNLDKGISCIYAQDENEKLVCVNNKCEYKEIDFKNLMEEEHVYKREHRRIKQVR